MILFLFGLSLVGCASPPQKVLVVTPKESTEPLPPPAIALDLIDKEILYLNNILQRKDLSDEERKVALDLLKANEKMKALSQLSTSHEDYRNIIQILLNNLDRLDKAYFSKRRPDKESYLEIFSLFSLRRNRILNAYLSGDYQGVIRGCMELESEFGPNSITPELGLLFSMSLAAKGKLKEAAAMAEKIVREMDRKPDLLTLRANMVRWEMDLGNQKKAIQIYERLTDNMEEMNALIRTAKNKISPEEKPSLPPELPTDEISMTSQSAGLESGSIANLSNEVNQLTERRAFDEARPLLIKWRIRAQKESEMETIDQALKIVELAEEKYKMEEPRGSPSPISPSQNKEAMEVAKRLIEEESFEDALKTLEELKDDPETASETRVLKDMAIEKLIIRERNEAAKLFLLAGKTKNPPKKKELLLLSHKKLKDLIDRYPSSNLIDKLNDNLNRVKKELDKLGVNPG